MLKETFIEIFKNRDLLTISNLRSRFKRDQFIEFIIFNN